MKVESATQNYQASTFNLKSDFIKPAFKANVSDEFISTVAHNAGDTGNTVGWIAGVLVLLGSGFAFFRNRKANIDRKLAEAAREVAEKAKLEAEENAKKLEQELEKWSKSVDENIKNILNEPRKSQGSTGKKSDGILGINKGNHSSGSHAGSSNGTNSRINSGDKSGSHNSSSSNNRTNVNTSSAASPSTVAVGNSNALPKPNSEVVSTTTTNGTNATVQLTEEEIQKRNEEIDRMIQETNEFFEEYNRKLDKTMKNLEENKEAVEFMWSSNKRYELDNAKGFNRILGYKPQKDFIKNKLINPIKDNKNVPNIFLMYGPKGTGKTLFAKAAAHESNSNYIQLELTLNPEGDLETLKQAIKQSVEVYNKIGQRSIIHLDEIDGLSYSKEYADILSRLSDRYHATLIATTNHPKEINPIILNAKNSERMYVPPANQNDIGEILKYVLKDFAEPSIDYNKYAKMIIDNGNGSAYSNAKIYELADNIVNKHYGEIFNKKVQQKISSELVPVSEQEIRNAIENNLQPDITKETLETYKKVF